MFVNNLVSNSILFDIHDDTVICEHLVLVFLQQEVESFCESSLSRRAEEIILDTVRVRMATPDDTKRFKDVTINVSLRVYRAGEFFDRRSRDIKDPRGICLHPRVFKNLGHLTHFQSAAY
jgi:hypothetical protein